jgi:catechol 2,3-dioxygenase-like lactoylglutathione lyase family enzyme
MITGVNHITLAVRNTEESFSFYTQVLGCQPVARWPQGAYLLAGNLWLALHQDQQVRAGGAARIHTHRLQRQPGGF